MRAIALVMVCAACRIPDEHFSVRDAAGGDGNGSSDASTAKTAGYLLDKVDGLYRVTLDAASSTWAVAGSATQAGAVPVVVLASTHRTHLYVLDVGDTTSAPTQVLDFAIASDGGLSANGTVDLSSVCTAHKGMRASIASTTLLVVCPTINAVFPIAINADDSLGVVQTAIQLPAGVGAWDVKFARGGSCIVVLGPVLGKQLLSFTNSGTAVSTTTTTTLAPWNLAMHPAGQTVYVIGYDTSNHGGAESWSIAANCTLTQAVAPQTWSSTSTRFGGVVDPAGTSLYAIGDDGVYQYGVAGGQFTLNNASAPYLSPSIGAGGNYAGLIDSTLPSTLFVTGTTYGGTVIAQLGAGGVPASSKVLTTGGQPWSFAVAP